MHGSSTIRGNRSALGSAAGNRIDHGRTHGRRVLGYFALALGWLNFAQSAEFNHSAPHATINATVGRSVVTTGSGTFEYSFNGSTWVTKTAGAFIGEEFKSSGYTYWYGTFKETQEIPMNTVSPMYSSIWTVWVRRSSGHDSVVFDVTLDDSTVNYKGGSSGGSAPHFVLDPVTIDLGADASAPITVDDPYFQEPEPSPWEKFWGKDITVPIVSEPGQDYVEIEIGGKTYQFPVEPSGSDEYGSLAYVTLPIPEGWDGTATIDGVTGQFAPNIISTGNETMPYILNPYAGSSSSLPTGMSWGVVDLPEGMTRGGVVPLPDGMTRVDFGASTGGWLPVILGNSNGSTTVHNQSMDQIVSSSVSGTVTSSGGSTSGGSVSNSGSNSSASTGSTGLEDLEEQAIDAGSAAGFNGGGDEEGPNESLQGIAGQWETIKSQIQGKFGGFAPLATGGLPTQSNLTLNLDFGRFGSRQLVIDLTATPFPTIRSLSLVILTFHAAWFFIRWIKV
ncbi:hypothetical protein HNR46_000097 [Haloferula luteola]|uniref:Uncharacterized protein n=1 Tax=Haloferula luteola TaxID=595692 RepID=A0A840UYH6_9BACT|nr:hypothetical protein [Haloferula luteola]MBB5349876.1 hypothetical protein [Haloferula luteola]